MFCLLCPFHLRSFNWYYGPQLLNVHIFIGQKLGSHLFVNQFQSTTLYLSNFRVHRLLKDPQINTYIKALKNERTLERDHIYSINTHGLKSPPYPAIQPRARHFYITLLSGNTLPSSFLTSSILGPMLYHCPAQNATEGMALLPK